METLGKQRHPLWLVTRVVVYGDFGPNHVTVSFEIVKYELIVSSKKFADRFLTIFDDFSDFFDRCGPLAV